MKSFLDYYARKDIQKAIAESSKNREVAVKYSDKGFGKRPDIIQFDADVFELAKQGATSFHLSEEQWTDPLMLKAGMRQSELDNLRTGWDLILDLDTKFIEFAKIATVLLVEALEFNDIKNISIKYSGGNGFHIGIPFKSFPEKVNNVETKLLFPEGARIIVSYLKELIKEPLRDRILKISSLSEISKNVKKPKIDLIKKNQLDPFSVVELDSVLISNRHMFRAPYSINEKKGLVSIPITKNQISSFKLSQAIPKRVTTNIKFLDDSKIKGAEATQLIIQAFDWSTKNRKQDVKEVKKQDFEVPKIAIKEEQFPLCIKEMLRGIKDDGRKRAVFILINFLRHMGWKKPEIEKRLLEWNKHNYELLREGYILTQLNWSFKQSKPILPPNCENESYYKSMAICNPENLCKLIKNPVNYTIRKLRLKEQNKSNEKKKRV